MVLELKGCKILEWQFLIIFPSHYKSLNVVRPGVKGLSFQKLSYGDAGKLTKPFSLDEVK